jgi:hypothetical protein
MLVVLEIECLARPAAILFRGVTVRKIIGAWKGANMAGAPEILRVPCAKLQWAGNVQHSLDFL